MKIEKSPIRYSLGTGPTPNIYTVHLVFTEDRDKPSIQKYKKQWDSRVFRGESGQRFFDESEQIILMGLGSKDKLILRKVANAFFALGDRLSKWDGVGFQIVLAKDLTDRLPADQLVYHIIHSLEIGFFKLRSLATKDKPTTKPGEVSFRLEDNALSDKVKKSILRATNVARYVNGARYIAHLPSNYFTPESFEQRSREIAKEEKLKITVFNDTQLKKLGMNGILAVSQGSNKGAKMILLEYKPVGAKKTLAIIGKGLTFDSGGISIKPSADMHEMKYDMCGAGAAIHAIGAIAASKIPLRVITAIGVAENMPDAGAIKPGDVYTAYNGLTVEVQNTDAEGRLVLGDVLAYVSEKVKPDYMVDLATLTGAAIIALGNEAAALLSNNSELTKYIQNASESSCDRVWELPLWDEYGTDLKSDIADLKNITGGGRGAGTISGAMFLSHFVGEGIPWAHLDIAGTAWTKKASGTQPSGATGFGVRLLVDLADEIAKS